MFWLPLLWLAAAPAPTRVDGGAALEVVEDVVAFHSADIAACWDKSRGHVQAEWLVSDGGSVEQARVAATRPPTVGLCLDEQLRRLEFPPGGTTWVSHRFSPSSKPLPAEVEPRDGGLTQAQVAELVRARREEIVACYAAARAENPKLEGRVTLRLSVGPSGAVLARSIEEASEGVKASSVPGCVLAAVRSWTFAASADGRPRRVLQPFLLAGSKAFADLHLRPDEPEMVAVFAASASAPDAGQGGLSKDVIAKVIRRHQNEIKFCYEQKPQQLTGKVAVHFWIEADGLVKEAAVAETTLQNATVEQCMVGRIVKWRFPEPLGGGKVSVTFPWIFLPAGSKDED